AEVMANAGIDDIYIANQVVQKSKIERLVHLNRYSSVSVAVDNPENVKTLAEAASKKGMKVKTIIEIDVGLHRSGVPPGKPALDLAKKISHSKGLLFEGVMGWEGDTAFIKDFKTRKKECHKCYKKTIETVKQIEAEGIEVNTIGAAGTTTFNIAAEYPGINEIQPGHYIFMSPMHRIEGIPFKQSLTVLSTIVSRPAVDRAIIDSGEKTISIADGLPRLKDVSGIEIKAFHVEHGILKMRNPSKDFRVGDTVELIPAYTGTTVNLHDRLYVVKGDYVEAVWRVGARGRID
ncbi:alanine racemase, partial [[Eubacterium] cellulosolvens]